MNDTSSTATPRSPIQAQSDLKVRLNKLLDQLSSTNLHAGRGIGNEIGYYIFEYDAAHEPTVRAYLPTLMEHLPKRTPGLRVVHVNLLELVVTHLRDRNLLDKSLQLGRDKGDAKLQKALAGFLNESKLTPTFTKAAQPDNHDLILVSGVGSVFPLLRAHTLLNNLHKHTGDTPLVLFYPGKYDGQTVRLFGQSTLSKNYYRAFRLEP